MAGLGKMGNGFFVSAARLAAVISIAWGGSLALQAANQTSGQQ
jgi:hypothetical protein